MKVLLFAIGVLCRRIKLEPKEQFVFRDKVTANQMYKFMYQAPRSGKIEMTVFDTKGRQMIKTRDPYSVLYSKMNEDGEIVISVKNNSSKGINFGYRCPDTSKKAQGDLGPISVDLVSELQEVLETIIQAQRVHIKKHEEHARMVAGSRKWVTRLLIFETLFFTGVLYFLHKDMLKMFETKREV
ncbi:putative endoplasmic reticulum membrane protein [Encephalitozoon intestinalis ATCC 50506]|uniref:Endoplasmic reticulum membrane protein n=1 Tax=Encephalitozoon intestinalis (strain ATCC 50506) TaxID=876142 RepID=E0S6C3_ENCIT|nr:putative endoplasmic reticulum membrane protein [Encephalitozoon intestinalis ATCC 50506]ADM11258.1 putative endoplasmic reticulum membrane protein [Encephalitozoon intestinalis ATCC 50506]UTX44926.1 emp24/gp25L/p24 family/GOLD-like protein [Encephalitozoon intestinalis]